MSSNRDSTGGFVQDPGMVELGIGTVNLLYIPDGLGKKEGEGREREERRIEDAGAQREAQVQQEWWHGNGRAQRFCLGSFSLPSLSE